MLEETIGLYEPNSIVHVAIRAFPGWVTTRFYITARMISVAIPFFYDEHWWNGKAESMIRTPTASPTGSNRCNLG